MSTNKAKTTSTVVKLQQVEALIERLERRINRTHNAWVKACTKRRRLNALLAKEPDDERKPIAKPVELMKPDPVKPEDYGFADTIIGRDKAARAAADDPLDVRSQPWLKPRNEADEKAKADILAAKAVIKKVKAKASADKSRAKRRGELRKMPLEGKAALAAIRESK
jgi:hypothetical protein